MKLIAEIQSSLRYAQALLFTSDGTEMATAGQDPAIKVWSVPEFDLVRALRGT